MEKGINAINNFLSILASLIILVGIFGIIHFKDKKKERIEEALQLGLEAAYFEGQKDALEDDIRIKLENDSTYIWTKSPWDDGKKPIFDPKIDLEKNIELRFSL